MKIVKSVILVSLVTLVLILSYFALNSSKVALYSHSTMEKSEAMLTILSQHSISAEVQRDENGRFAILADEEDSDTAVLILAQHGYSPSSLYDFCEALMEENASYPGPAPYITAPERAQKNCELKAESEEIVSNLKGVEEVRAYIRLPEQGQAILLALYIRQAEGVDLESQVPAIKKLISEKIPQLHPNNISIALGAQTDSAP